MTDDNDNIVDLLPHLSAAKLEDFAAVVRRMSRAEQLELASQVLKRTLKWLRSNDSKVVMRALKGVVTMGTIIVANMEDEEEAS